MSHNPSQPSASTFESAAGLGPVLVRCRDRSSKDLIQATGQSVLAYWWMPLILPIVLAGLLLMGLEKVGAKPSEAVAPGLIVAVFLAFNGWFFWQLFHRPKTTSLVLYQGGFRYKKLVIPFDDLAALRFGGRPSGLAAGVLKTNQVMGRVSFQNAAGARFMEQSYARSMTVVFKTGEEKLLGAMQTLPEPADLARFFDQLHTLRPNLVEESPASPPGRDDLPWTGPPR